MPAPRTVIACLRIALRVAASHCWDATSAPRQTQRGDKLLIKPSKESVSKMRQRPTAEMRSIRGAGPADITRRLNPIILGWAAHHRPVVASEAFAKLDNHLWPLTYRWARRRHPLKSWRWVSAGISADSTSPDRKVGLLRPR
jgi:hypothetical protein